MRSLGVASQLAAENHATVIDVPPLLPLDARVVLSSFRTAANSER
jgi:hypothetical protein